MSTATVGPIASGRNRHMFKAKTALTSEAAYPDKLFLKHRVGAAGLLSPLLGLRVLLRLLLVVWIWRLVVSGWRPTCPVHNTTN
eukprot:scaffold40413_cov45-Prasinocladus_malaysianus.AAC.1